MMELEEALLCTAAAIAAYEGAAPAVAEPDRAPDLCRDVSRAWKRAAAPSRSICGGELLLGKILEKRGQCPIEDRRQVSVRDLVAQEVLREPELLVRFSTRGELHLIALGRQWADDGGACSGWHGI